MIRKLRIASGLVLFSYLLTHNLNHALGLVSLEALEAGRLWFLELWRNIPASLLLYSALLTHLGLAFWALYQRRRLAMPAWEWTQLISGLSIPPLLALHVLGTRYASEILGLEGSYLRHLLIYFQFDPVSGFKQIVVLLVAWLHGCLGLFFWLRFRPWFPRFAPWFLIAAVLLPTLALLGVLVAGRDLLRLAQDVDWLAAAVVRAELDDSAMTQTLLAAHVWVLGAFFSLLAATLLLRALRIAWARRHGFLQLGYPDGRRVKVTTGTTILEASRGAGIPHASVCGGRGRCSTCRVRVGVGWQDLSPPSEAEQRVLTRIAAPPNVRLACQTRPTADLEVVPLLPATVPAGAANPRANYLQGDEREVAILFADLRGFTTLSQDKLPYDVVFLLNRYFAAMGAAVEQSGGRVDKFIGDGVMALFGVERGVADGCRNALTAATRMAEQLGELNAALKSDLPQPLRIGIGIHAGPVIVGEMGYGHAVSVTAIGDTVNTASRLEGLTKDFSVQLVVSEPVARHAGADLAAYPSQEIAVRGRSGSLAIHLVTNALTLSSEKAESGPAPTTP